MSQTIKPFSSDIQGHIETYNEDHRSFDLFQWRDVKKRRKHSEWANLVLTEAFKAGYERIKLLWYENEEEVKRIAEQYFLLKSLSDDDKEVLLTGYPKFWKDAFPEIEKRLPKIEASIREKLKEQKEKTESSEPNIIPLGENYHRDVGWY